VRTLGVARPSAQPLKRRAALVLAVVVAGGFLRHGGSAEQKAKYIPGIIDGSKTFGFAQLEKNSRYDLFDVVTTAKKKGDGWVIDGEKFVVLNGENADTLIVTARTKGGQRDKAGIGVFLVPADAKGITKKGYPTQDGLHAADLAPEQPALHREVLDELVDLQQRGRAHEVLSARKQATLWPGEISRSGGSAVVHEGCTKRQRAAKRQPALGATSLGTVPGIASSRSLWTAAVSMRGIERIRPWV
jgi:hypothetical protein